MLHSLKRRTFSELEIRQHVDSVEAFYKGCSLLALDIQRNKGQVRLGVLFALEMGFLDVVIESDSANVVRALHRKDLFLHLAL